MPIDEYFEIFDDCIYYTDFDKQPYTAAQIIKNAYNMVLSTVIYIYPRNMGRKKAVSEKHGLKSKSYLRNIFIISTNYNT